MLMRVHKHSDLLIPAVLPAQCIQLGYLLARRCRGRLSILHHGAMTRNSLQQNLSCGCQFFINISLGESSTCPPTQSIQSSQILFLGMCTSGFTLLPREVLLYILYVVAAFPASQELRQHEGIVQVLQKQALFSHSSHTT